MPYHRKAMDQIWDTLLSEEGTFYQSEPELSVLKSFGIKDKAIVHLACNNGIELLSLKKMGAGACAGFDICDEAIKDAKLRSSRLNLPVHFEQCNVYDIPPYFNGSFDLVYITIGAMVWLPDLQEFYAVAKRLLKPGGSLFIYEQHPFTEVLPWNLVDGSAPEIENNYFPTEPIKGDGSLDYYGNVEYDAPDTYEFVHPLSEIMTAIIENGFRITSFTEYETDISNGFGWIEKCEFRLPLSYILTAVVG
jgi:SAM-dependent methyltransferase